MKKTTPTPTPNLNGTSREALVQQKIDAFEAVRKAQAALRESSPHGRDYQTLPNGAEMLREARDLHFERMQVLGDLSDALMAEAIAIDQAG